MKGRKAEKTKKFIIEQTAPIFNQKGISATSLSDIMEVTSLSKGAIYGIFRDKEAIAKAVFRYSADKMKSSVAACLAKETSVDQLFSFLDFFYKNVFSTPVTGGCPLINTAVEADDNFPSLKKMAGRELLSCVNYVEGVLKEGKKRKELSADINPRETAFALFASLESAMVMSRVNDSVIPIRQVVNYWKKQIKKYSIN